jgi:hypothetical protein
VEVLLARSLKMAVKRRTDEQKSPQEPHSGVQGEGAIATVEAIGVLQWPAADVQILSLGCTTAPLDIDFGRNHSLGCLGWTTKLASVFMAAQSVSAIGMVQHLLPDRNQLTRISPIVGKGRFALDGVKSIRELRGVGEFEARTQIPRLRSLFFDHPVTEEFVPFHSVARS